MAHNKIEILEKLVRELYESENSERADWADWLYHNHVFLVSDKARELALQFEADSELAEAAGMLHDIADAVMSRFDPGHETRSAEIAEDFLKQTGFSVSEVEWIINDALRFHSCHNGELPQTEEGKVLASADAVVHLESDFYLFAKEQLLETKTVDEVNAWVLPKIERDYNIKIQFPQLRDTYQKQYENLKQLFT